MWPLSRPWAMSAQPERSVFLCSAQAVNFSWHSGQHKVRRQCIASLARETNRYGGIGCFERRPPDQSMQIFRFFPAEPGDKNVHESLSLCAHSKRIMHKMSYQPCTRPYSVSNPDIRYKYFDSSEGCIFVQYTPRSLHALGKWVNKIQNLVWLPPNLPPYKN